MGELPTGTITFLFSDIEGSTRLLRALGSQFESVLERHRILVREAVQRHGGFEISADGDSFFCVFNTAQDALTAAVDIHRAMEAQDWPDGHAVRVRIGVHTGVAAIAGDSYVGLDVHRASRISETGHGGQVILSAATRLLGEAGLPDGVTISDLGEFHLKDLDQPEHLFQLVIEGLDSVFPPLQHLDSGPTNLSAGASTFVGRDRERQEVQKLLDESRLVTITGVAGAGKSRLAVEVANSSRGTFHDGVWHVELAPVRDDGLVARAVANAIGLQESPGRLAIEVLVDYLREGKRLCVFDNCEHVVDGVGELAGRLLAAGQELRILATSRQVLGISGETRYPCPPLAVPELPAVSPASVLDFDSVELFDIRAREVDPTFRLDDTNAPIIAEICQRLDGMPLAIELAAALVRILTPQEIVDRLDRRFELLKGGPRTAPTHQQTLGAALDSTFELLDERQQEFAARLGVFVGSFDVEAAEAVASGGIIDRGDVIDALTSLVDRSLITSIPRGGELRLTILESVRQYLLAELDVRGQLEERQLAHQNHFAGLIEVASMAMRGPNQETWARRLETDIENVRAAIAFAAEKGDEAALELVNRMFLYWLTRGEWSDALFWCRLALSKTSREDSGLRARVLATAGFFASDLGDAAAGIADLEEALDMAHRAGDIHAQGYCSSFLGTELSRRDMDLDRGLALLSEAQRIYQELGEPYGEAWVNRYLALSHQERGDLEEAIRLQTLSLDSFQEVGDTWNIRFAQSLLAEAMHTVAKLDEARALYDESLRGSSDARFKVVIAHALKGLGKVSLAEGRLDEASNHLKEGLGELREIGDMACTAETIGHLAMVNLARGQTGQAAELLSRSLRTFYEMNDQGGVAWTLERLAAVAFLNGSHTQATRLLGAGSAIRERSGSKRAAVDQPDVSQLQQDLEKQLGVEVFTSEAAAGAALELDEAVALGNRV